MTDKHQGCADTIREELEKRFGNFVNKWDEEDIAEAFSILDTVINDIREGVIL